MTGAGDLEKNSSVFREIGRGKASIVDKCEIKVLKGV